MYDTSIYSKQLLVKSVLDCMIEPSNALDVLHLVAWNDNKKKNLFFKAYIWLVQMQSRAKT